MQFSGGNLAVWGQARTRWMSHSVRSVTHLKGLAKNIHLTDRFPSARLANGSARFTCFPCLHGRPSQRRKTISEQKHTKSWSTFACLMDGLLCSEQSGNR
jgi:hypothetical protein